RGERGRGATTSPPGTGVGSAPPASRTAFQLGRASGGIGRPSADHSISVASRRALVSSFFALVTQYALVRRYQAGCRDQYAHAPASARRRASISGGSAAVARS